MAAPIAKSPKIEAPLLLDSSELVEVLLFGENEVNVTTGSEVRGAIVGITIGDG
jgi:hypothetical protein